jgi:hypothetical protein
MGILESFHDELILNIEESLELIRTANWIMSQSGLRTNLSIKQRDFIVEWAFVGVHAAWERFLESSFIAYMLGVKTASGFAPLRYVFPNDKRHALEIVLGGREYFPWTAPEAVRRQSILCFEDGQPFREILESTTNELQEINTLRNAIVHRSHSAVEKFKSLVRDKMLTIASDVGPANFLLTVKSGTARRTYFSYYCNKLKIVANKITPS